MKCFVVTRRVMGLGERIKRLAPIEVTRHGGEFVWQQINVLVTLRVEGNEWRQCPFGRSILTERDRCD
jgi:hypothetical protein